MNKVVEVYSISRCCRAVIGDAPPPHVAFYSINIAGDRWLTPGGCDERTRVHILNSEVHLVHTPEGDRYIAMEPGLREILEAPFEAAVLAAEERERNTREWADDAVARATERTRRMLAMPWWKRMWFAAFKRNLVG